MEWPYRRFLKAYDAFQRRSLCEEWKARRTAHISALWANTNLDGEEADRSSILQKVERWYAEVIATIWNGEKKTQTQKAEEDAWGSSFMGAARRGMGSISPPRLPGESEIGALPA